MAHQPPPEDDAPIIHLVRSGIICNIEIHDPRHVLAQQSPHEANLVQDLRGWLNGRLLKTNIPMDLSSEGDGVYDNTNPPFLAQGNTRHSPIDPTLVLNILSPGVVSDPNLNALVSIEINPTVNNAKLMKFLFNNIGEGALAGIRINRPPQDSTVIRNKCTLAEVEIITFCALSLTCSLCFPLLLLLPPPTIRSVV